MEDKKVVIRSADDMVRIYMPARYERERRKRLTTAERLIEDVRNIMQGL